MQLYWWKVFDDYSCIKDINPPEEVCHYTCSADAIIDANGIANGILQATNLMDFRYKKEDILEGILILQNVQNLISKENIFNDEQKDYIFNFIGSYGKSEEFANKYITNIVSLSDNMDSDYMWENYAKDDGYCVIFDQDKLTKSLYLTRNNKSEDKVPYIKHSKIIYNKKEQYQIMLSRINALMASDFCGLSEEDKIKEILNHLIFIGNFFKTEDFQIEEEYRLAFNCVSLRDYPGVVSCIPEQKVSNVGKENEKHYVDFHFDPDAINKIICASEKAKSDIEEVIGTKNILLELRHQ